MELKRNREMLAEDVAFYSVQDPKFRHNGITINLIVPLEEGKASSTALLACLLRKNCADYPDFTELEKKLSSLYGAELTSDILRLGEMQIISASILFLDDAYTLDGEIISDECASLLGGMVLRPNLQNGAFSAADFLLEQQNLIDTIEADINEKRTYALEQCRQMLFEGRRLALSKYGTIEEAQSVTPESAAERYREVIDTARIEISFIGCGDPAPAREQFRKLFQPLKRHPVRHTPEPLTETVEMVRRKMQEMEIAQSKLVMGFRVGRLESRSQINALRLASYLYGGCPFSKLFLNVRERDHLCYYCASRYNQVTGVMLVDCGIERENREAAEQGILEQLKAMQDGDFTEEEVSEAKLAFRNAQRSVGDSIGSIDSWFLTQILRGDCLSPAEDEQNICSVTKEEMTEAIRKVALDSVYFLTGKEESDHD